MKVFFSLLIITIFNFCFINNSFGQRNLKKENNFSQVTLDTYRISSNTYELWWSKGGYNCFTAGDTLPAFVDMRQYKGVLNYGVTFSSTNGQNFHFIENFSMYKLNIDIAHCKFNKKDSIVEIEGTITGGWSGSSWNGIQNNVDIFIGKKKDTVTLVRSKQFIKSKDVAVFYEGKKVIDHKSITLDTLPSFSIYDYTHYKTNQGNERTFKIKSKIDINSLLIFGLGSCYTEIYDIGKMVYAKNIVKPKKKRKPKNLTPDVIIRNNIQESNKENSLVKEKPSYYIITEKAENYILRKQYGKAKQEYDQLLKDNQYVFARDMHNAVRCAIFTRDYKTAINWSEKLVLKGVPIKYFDAKIFDRIKNHKDWNDFLKRFDSLHKKHLVGLNYTLIKRLEELIDIDQTEYIKNSKGEIEQSELSKTTEFVDKELIKLIQKEGFPTEEKIGVVLAKDSMSIATASKYFVLIVHSYQKNHKTFQEIKNIREKATKNFEYDAIRDNLEVFKSVGNTCLKIYKGDLYTDKTCSINELQVKKIVFRFNNEHRFIIDAGRYTIIPLENEDEDDKYVAENFDFVMKLTDDWLFYEK
ncbi:hypothetical protein ATE84_0689 [Aquimarina sp. MAR_2010_214]|uniref:hypothetical protein n=1 Tax=Aquimarina sp. MAR_2010_214 TaxID=1250026 RepID=UPI000C706D8E|nr:hypothetical protein [Aquimarina sp. MAR_2010_214]PKV48683.1 hypothetical protein ATE84_0689 [Aquimarina sp. MAR_2010_214]